MAPDQHNLPAHLPTLIGRDEEVSAVRRRLLDAEAGMLTLTGAGGSGKTRLALAVAATLLNEFADGVWLVEFAPVGDPGVPLPRVMRPMRDRDLANTRARLGAHRFAAAWTRGQAMSADEAVEYARTDAVAPADPQRAAPPRDPLTRREREIAELLTHGYTNREIAEVLTISERTAAGHVANILGKLELKTRAQVAVWAIEHQLASARK